MADRIGQVGQGDRVLGAQIAASAAVPASGARRLGDSGNIHGFLEVDDHRRGDGLGSKRSACSR